MARRARAHTRPAVAVAAAMVAALPGVARAGMPIGPTLSEAARARLDTISFFLLVLLAGALLVMLVWNYLRRDFARLPRLSYPKSCALVALWGLLFVVVLLMISGARELLTPGAWERSGATYRLRDPAGADAAAAAGAVSTAAPADSPEAR